MQNEEISLSELSKPRSRSSLRSRRALITGFTAAGLAGTLGIPLLEERAIAASGDDKKNDAAILHNVL